MNRQQRRAAKRDQVNLSEAEMDAVGEDAEKNGCSRCGLRFAEGLPYLVMRVNSQIKPRCINCYDDAQLLCVGLFIGGGDPWAVDDREWFKNHPTRSYRLRAPWRGELESMAMAHPDDMETGVAFLNTVKERGYRLAVVVHQLEPGKRCRSLAGVPGDDPYDTYTDAGIKHFVPGSDKLGDGVTAAGGSEAVYKEQMMRRLKVTAAALDAAGIQRD